MSCSVGRNWDVGTVLTHTISIALSVEAHASTGTGRYTGSTFCRMVLSLYRSRQKSCGSQHYLWYYTAHRLPLTANAAMLVLFYPILAHDPQVVPN
jgi:hypothetical protein